MPDLTSKLLPAIRQHRLPGLDLGGDFVYPDYSGRSVLNLSSSVCRLLGVPNLGAVPLDAEYLAPLGGEGGARRVILILVDALALHRLQSWMAQGALPVWQELTGQGLLAPLTSISPSTTSAALTSLWTGRSPAEHGITGYEMWLKEYGMIVNTILHSPAAYQKDAGSLARAGFSPREFMPLPTLGPHLSARGVKSFAFQHHSLLHSGLSEIFFLEVTRQGVQTAADLWINLRQLLESYSGGPLYASVYWGEVDTFSHRYGPDDERTAAEFIAFSAAFQRLFLDKLNPAVRRDTVVILTSDHGQITSTPDPYYDLRNHPGLTRRLHLLPTGESRLSYLYVRPGQTEAVREYVERTWPGQFALLDAPYAIEAGLLGNGELHPHLLDRVGDFILAARGQAYFFWGNKENHMLGRHGGLHPDEMLVPFLASKL